MYTMERLCLLYLIMWHQVDGSMFSSVTFKKTPVNIISLIKNIQHGLVHDSASILHCAVKCSLDDTCQGFGYRESPSNQCLHITTNKSNETNLSNSEGFEYFLLKELPTHCGQVSNRVSALTLLDIADGQLLVAQCEQDISGEEWLVFQQRLDGSENFYRSWDDYKVGFGKPWGEFWIGNDNLHQLTKDGNAILRIELGDLSGITVDVKYTTFIVESEAMKYRLVVNGYDGVDPPGNSLAYHNGMNFTTYDDDNDLRPNDNCADMYKGGWWYKSCHSTNLNGLYGSTTYGIGINWYAWKGLKYSLPHVRMMLKLKPGI